AIDIVVVDSVAALVPRAELEGEMGEAQMGLQARLMSQALRKLTGIVSKSKTTLVFINQIREKIGVMFGNPETTTGGRALKFYASVRIDIRRIASLKEGEVVTGSRAKVKVVKAQALADLGLELVGEIRVLPQERLGVVASLAEAQIAVGVPGAALDHQLVIHPEVHQLAALRDPLAVVDIELGLAEG